MDTRPGQKNKMRRMALHHMRTRQNLAAQVASILCALAAAAAKLLLNTRANPQRQMCAGA